MSDSITVNGKEHPLEQGELELSLLDYIRERLELTGTKYGCGTGACGSCTVLIDGAARKACVLTVAKAAGREVTTIEALQESDGSLHPLQQAFIDAGAIQCGYCTPGMVMVSLSLLKKKPSPSREDIRKALAGNICRCTGYQQIVDAVEIAAQRMRDA
jgi:carbon-monoxide dehydrogenase small subunit